MSHVDNIIHHRQNCLPQVEKNELLHANVPWDFESQYGLVEMLFQFLHYSHFSVVPTDNLTHKHRNLSQAANTNKLRCTNPET